MVKSFDVVFQNWFGRHVRADVTIINTIERIQLDGESFEMSGQKSGIDGIIACSFTFPLNVIQENRDMRNVLFREPMKQKFVHEDFSEPVFAAGFDRADDFHKLAFLHNQVLLETHFEFGDACNHNWNGNDAGSAIHTGFVQNQSISRSKRSPFIFRAVFDNPAGNASSVAPMDC